MAKTPGDRTTMHVLYGMHTVAPFTLWTLSVIALIVHYVKRADEQDVLYLAHHNYMIRTVWWTAAVAAGEFAAVGPAVPAGGDRLDPGRRLVPLPLPARLAALQRQSAPRVSPPP